MGNHILSDSWHVDLGHNAIVNQDLPTDYMKRSGLINLSRLLGLLNNTQITS